MATGRMTRFYDQEGHYVSLEELIDWVRAHPLKDGRILPIIIWGGFGIGKCVRGDTPIWINGYSQNIEDIWQEYHGDVSPDPDGSGGEWSKPISPITTTSLDASGQIIDGEVVYIYRQKISEWGRRVVLEDGSEITMTRRHRLKGINGWQRDISVGDMIAVPKRVSGKNTSVDNRLAKLLAWQIAEGYESSKRATVEISQKDKSALENLRKDAKSWAKSQEIDMGKMSIYLDKRSGVYKLTINSSEYKEWLEGHGYAWGLTSASKRIPDWLVSADSEALRVFLSEYIACEGHVSKNSACIEITSASKEIMGQLSIMLRRLDVWLRRRKKSASASNGSKVKRRYWAGSISGESFYRLAAQMAIADAAKQSRVNHLATLRKKNSTNTEGIPLADLAEELIEITDLPKRRLGWDRNVVKGQGASQRAAREALAATTAIADGTAAARFKESSFSRQENHPHYRQISSAFEEIDPDSVADIAERISARVGDEVHYAKVVSVDDVWLDEYVYDMEVADHHNYVADGIVCHNTQQIKAYGRDRNLEVRTYHPAHDVNGADIVGKAYHEQSSGETRYALPAWLPREDGNDPEEGLLFIDELNRAPEEVLAGLMEPLGEGTIAQSGWKLPEGWNIVAAANPSEMGYMVQELDEAMVDRMLHYAPGWDARYWGAWAESANISKEIIDFALQQQGVLVSTGEAQLPLEIENKLRTTPRTLEYIGALYDPEMSEGLLRVCTDGLMGREPGQAFRDMLLREESPLRGEEILSEPEDTGQGLVYPYDEKIRRWSVDNVHGEALISASSERLVISLLGEEPSSDDPRENRKASLAGRYLAFIPAHLREGAINSIARSAPNWLAPVQAAVLGWTEALAKQQQIYTRRESGQQLPQEPPQLP